MKLTGSNIIFFLKVLKHFLTVSAPFLGDVILCKITTYLHVGEILHFVKCFSFSE